MNFKLEVTEWTLDPKTNQTDGSGRAQKYETYDQVKEAYEYALAYWEKRGKIILGDVFMSFTCIISETAWVDIEVNLI